MNYILFLILSFISFNSFSECIDKTPAGYPLTSVETTLLCRKAYLVEYHDQCKIPIIVSEHLNPSEIGGIEPRVSFRQDPDLPKESRSTMTDYTGSNYDKGHMAPAGNMKTDSESMRESFYLSNIVPQAPKNNRGIWKRLEERVRALSVKHDGVFVITGVVLGDDMIGNGVCVPKFMYKTIIKEDLSEGIAYLIPNINEVGSENISIFEVTVGSVEKFANVNLIPNIQTDKAAMIRNKIGSSLK